MSESEKMVIPEKLDFGSLKKILQGYLEADADKKAVTYKQVASVTVLSGPSISLNNKFFVYVNLLTEETRGHYKLTSLGASFARSLIWQKFEDAAEILRSAIKECPLFIKIISFVRLNKEVKRDSLVAQIGSIAKVPTKKRFLIGINAVIELLLFAKRISEKEGTITLIETVEKEIKIPSEEVELLWFIIDGEYYGIERAFLVDTIKKQGQKVHNKPIIL